MKILFITQLFPYNKKQGHTSGALREFIEQWGSQGHRIKVVRPHFSYEKETYPSQNNYWISDNIEVDFIRPFRIPVLKYSFYPLSRIIKNLDFKPDVIICHLFNSYFLFHKLSKLLNVPLVTGIHMSDIQISKNPFFRWRQQRIFRRSQAFACRSHRIQELFSREFPEFMERSFLALSGIPGKYMELPVPSAAPSPKVKIITVSRLIKKKQIDKVLLSLSTLNLGDLDWSYTIIGEGPEKEKLRRLAQQKGISDKVDFRGQQGRDTVIKEMLEHDVFILPSFYETLGLVYLESLACGCITIGSEYEGIDGVIHSGKNGFLCNPYKIQSIKDTLYLALTMSDSKRRAMIKNGLNTAKNFNIKQKAQDYIEQIKSHI
jgi:glycosyltransferase involved in cell wall biosynthesis